MREIGSIDKLLQGEEFGNELKELVKIAELAYSPYSNIKVGAMVETDDGQKFYGCNVENASYSLTICAERNAVLKMVTSGILSSSRVTNLNPRVISRVMVIFSDLSDGSPCGACLQFISEFADDNCEIYFVRDGIFTMATLSELLPLPFE